jgi:hypothetical protein
MMNVRHVTDEELLLDYYGEASAEDRASMRAHLESCMECRALEHELRGVLALVDTEPVPEAPVGFEQDVWARLEPVIAARRTHTDVVSDFPGRRSAPREGGSPTAGRSSWRFELPRWGLAAAAVALAAGSFALGRVWDRPSTRPESPTADARALNERLLRSEVEQHLERSQRVLVELVNADDADAVMLANDRALAADLVADGRLYRRSAERIGDAGTRDLLEDVERVLVEVANGPATETSNDLSGVRARISEQDLLFRLRVTMAEMREQERRARPVW